MTLAVWMAFAAGAVLLITMAELVHAAGPTVRGQAPALVRRVAALSALAARAGRDGSDPGAAERRRLVLAGAATIFVAGTAVAGVRAGFLLACAVPWLLARVLRARRERYRRAVEDGAPAIAMGLADALGGGHSLRGALTEAARGVDGPAGRELTRVARELELGARTEDALEAMRGRVPARAIDTIVAAALLQRRAGGDLARLLRASARAFEDEARVAQEARAATAQARFTGVIVVLMPLGGAGLAELASPGYLAQVSGSFLTAWLVGIAIGLQVVAAVLVRRLGRVRA